MFHFDIQTANLANSWKSLCMCVCMCMCVCHSNLSLDGRVTYSGSFSARGSFFAAWLRTLCRRVVTNCRLSLVHTHTHAHGNRRKKGVLCIHIKFFPSLRPHEFTHNRVTCSLCDFIVGIHSTRCSPYRAFSLGPVAQKSGSSF